MMLSKKILKCVICYNGHQSQEVKRRIVFCEVKEKACCINISGVETTERHYEVQTK